jgi:hypothetical protein
VRHEKSIGLVFSEEHYGSVKRHLHYADPVLCFGEEEERVGRGKPVLVMESPVGFASLMGMKIVWGSDVDAVCLELSKGHLFTVFVSNKSPSKKIKAALNKLGKRAREVIIPEGVGRIISLNGSCCVQKLVSDEWQEIREQQTTKPKSKAKSKKSAKSAGEK